VNFGWSKKKQQKNDILTAEKPDLIRPVNRRLVFGYHRRVKAKEITRYFGSLNFVITVTVFKDDHFLFYFFPMRDTVDFIRLILINKLIHYSAFSASSDFSSFGKSQYLCLFVYSFLNHFYVFF